MSGTPHLGLRATATFGVGATVGGAAIVLAGPALVAAGPAVLLAVGLNALLAAAAALSLAELGTRFPRSGGPYVFAQQVFSVDAAFAVGWLVYFASIAAGAVFALGFAEVALAGAAAIAPEAEGAWWTGRPAAVTLALATVGGMTLQLARGGRGGGSALTIAKVATFAVLGAAGVAVAIAQAGVVLPRLTPFAPGGALGVAHAMGLLFVAFQGFALVAAMSGEVRDRARVLPRAMLIAVAVAAILYVPLFFAVLTVGVPEGVPLAAFAREHGANAVAEAARTYMGEPGFWLVTVTALLAMVTALQAHLVTAGRVAASMARDRTLPGALAGRVGAGRSRRGLLVSATLVAIVVVALPEIATAATAAGLIYLAIFTLAHVMAFLARRRAPTRAPYRAPAFAIVAGIGGAAASGLAVLNALSVPSAGILVLAWLAAGGAVYARFLARDAAALDAEHEGADPDLVQLRGRRPLVLVPIANPANAEALVTVAHALAPPRVGRVLLLSVVRARAADRSGRPGRAAQADPVEPMSPAGAAVTPAAAVTGSAVEPGAGTDPAAALATGIENAQRVLRASLTSALPLGLVPEALTTVSDDPWREIGRVARLHDCEVLLLGLSDLGDERTLRRLDRLTHAVRSDVVLLRAPEGWRLEAVRRVLVPLKGRDDQERLRARMLAATARLADPEVTFLQVLPEDAPEETRVRRERALRAALEGRELGRVRASCRRAPDPVATVVRCAAEADLVVLGLPRHDAEGNLLGPTARALVDALPTSCAVLMIHRREAGRPVRRRGAA